MKGISKLRKGLVNSTADWSANIITNDTAGYYLIKNAAGELLCPPIKRGSIISVTSEASAAEVLQWVNAGDSAQVIVAGARYSISIEFPKDRQNGNTHERRIYSVNAAATLSGTASTDRLNVYTALMNKINAYVNQYTKAKLATVFGFKGAATVTTAGFAVGAKWYVGASLGAATWVGYIAKATGALANATGQSVVLVTESGTFPTAPTTDVFKAAADDAVQSVADAASTYTAGQALIIYDQGGYWSLKEKLGRGGAPIVFNSPTFTTRPVIMQAAVYSKGIGTDMLAETPEYDLERTNVDRGNIQRQYTTAPVAGNTYKLYIIYAKADSSNEAIDGGNAGIEVKHEIYCQEAVNANVNSALVGLT